MDYQEFQKRDMELLSRIADLRMNAEDHNAQIAFNNKEIAILDFERAKLRSEYADSNIPN